MFHNVLRALGVSLLALLVSVVLLAHMGGFSTDGLRHALGISAAIGVVMAFRV